MRVPESSLSLSAAAAAELFRSAAEAAMMAAIEIRDSRRPARVTFAWEQPEGFRSPLVRVGLHYGDELRVSARILPGLRRSLVRFLENLASLEAAGTFEQRVFRSAETEFGITCYPASVCGGGAAVWVVRCEFSLASDWDEQYWVVQLRLDLEFSQLPALVSEFRDFFAQSGEAAEPDATADQAGTG
jgi:hypothetical protein